MDEFYFLVAVNSPFNGSLLTYKANQEMALTLKRGQLVKVPLGKRVIDGCLLGASDSLTIKNPEKIKAIVSVDSEIFLSEIECELYQWMANYYHYPLGQLIYDVLPPFLKRPRKLNFEQGAGEVLDLVMNDEQKNVVDKITKNGLESFSKWLVHGVTGAGKTLIYLELIRTIIAQKKSVLFLLPEINLTPQFLKTFQTYLDIPIYSYNSSINNSDKFGLWVGLDHCRQ